LLTDFGLARAEDDAALTRSGFHPGTPQYMSPEQVRGEAIDQRSDLFGLGCVLYVLCTGHPPFNAETGYAVMRRITDDTPHPIRDVNPDIPEWLEAIVMKLLSKSQDDRFASALEVAELLEGCLAHTQHPTTTSLPEAAAKQIQRRNGLPTIIKWIGAAMAAIALIFAGVLIVLETNTGTLTIKSDTDGVPIKIKQGDNTIRQLQVDRAGETIRLYAGQYTLEIDGTDTSFVVSKGNVVLKRGDTEIATITYRKNAEHSSIALTEKRLISEAVREFNNLHTADAQGRPQSPLSESEIYACLLLKLGNDELSEEVVREFFMKPVPKRGVFLPADWQFTGGLVRHRCEQGIIQTWEVNLKTNGLSLPIPIRQKAIAPPASLKESASLKRTDPTQAERASTPLGEAVDKFNASHPEIERFGQLPYELSPLTQNEVLAAILLWQTKRDEADVDDATFKRFQHIATTQQIPSDIRFELIPTIKNEIGQWFITASIRILVPRADKPGSNFAFAIRHRFVQFDRGIPTATNWSTPGSNGIQAGVRLVPGKRTYQYDEVVNVEFLYRSVTGKEVPAKLPRVLRYDKVSGMQIVLVNDVPQNVPDNSISTTIGKTPTVVRGHRMQICIDADAKLKDGVSMQAITKPGANHYVRFVIPNPGVNAVGEQLTINHPLRFNTPPLNPPKVLPLAKGHYYGHWGTRVPGHRRPATSTPDLAYIDPFQIGVSLGQLADKSRIPAYYAGGLQVMKVAPHSPASNAGIEVGDILLSWEGNQFYGDDPSGNFLKYSRPNYLLKEKLAAFEKMAKFNGLSSSSTRFVLLDHRTGEVIDISPWFGLLADGSSTKSLLIKRALERKRLRTE
jgi:hypothetical protein